MTQALEGQIARIEHVCVRNIWTCLLVESLCWVTLGWLEDFGNTEIFLVEGS